MATTPSPPFSDDDDSLASQQPFVATEAVLHDRASGQDVPVIVAPISPAHEAVVESGIPGAPPLSASYAQARAERLTLTGWKGALFEIFRTPFSYWESLQYKLSHLPQINYELARRLSDQGQVRDAILRYRITLWLAPSHQLSWYHLGTCYLAVGDRQKALAALAKAYALNPNHEETLFMIGTIDPAVLPASKRVAGMPKAIALDYFDRMAPNYDASQARMRYRGHMVAEAGLRDYLDSGRIHLHILDLGCGTGLVGSLLKRHAERLVGVDISRAMLERAGARRAEDQSRVYSETYQRDLRHFLADTEDQFELITAVHVFNYLGDLDAVFQHVGKAMTPGGLFLFQHEPHPGEGEYALMAGNARFGHSEAYVEGLVRQAGLEVVKKGSVDVYPNYPLWQWVVTKPIAERAPVDSTPAASRR